MHVDLLLHTKLSHSIQTHSCHTAYKAVTLLLHTKLSHSIQTHSCHTAYKAVALLLHTKLSHRWRVGIWCTPI